MPPLSVKKKYIEKAPIRSNLAEEHPSAAKVEAKPKAPQNPPRVRKPPPEPAPDPVGPCRCKFRARWADKVVNVMEPPWSPPFRITPDPYWRKGPFRVVWTGSGEPPAEFLDGAEKTIHPKRRDAQEAIQRFYRAWLMEPAQVELLIRVRMELKGKSLACWCGHRAACHGDVLIELANQPKEIS